jgi:hypothetical protein
MAVLPAPNALLLENDEQSVPIEKVAPESSINDPTSTREQAAALLAEFRVSSAVGA